MQELKLVVSRLCKANTEAASLTRVVAHLQGMFEDAPPQGKHNLSALQTRAEMTGTCYMPLLATILVDSSYWKLCNKSVKASSLFSRIFEGVLVVMQIWSILKGRLFIPTCAMHMRHVCSCCCPKVLDALATVVLYTNLRLIHNEGV